MDLAWITLREIRSNGKPPAVRPLSRSLKGTDGGWNLAVIPLGEA
jgi:hypothetical protein